MSAQHQGGYARTIADRAVITPAATPPKPTLRDLEEKLERLDDDLETEDLPDVVGRDRRR